MGTFIEKCFGFYQVREELEARISELEDENLAVKISGLENSNDQLWQAREKLKTEKTELLREKDNLANEKAELTDKNTELQKQIKSLEQSRQFLGNENQKLTTEKTELTEKNKTLTTEKENLNNQLNVSQKRVNALKNSHQVLENERAELLKAREKIAEEKTEMEKEMARLKDLEDTDKSELDLQNRRFKSAIDEKFMVTPLKSLRLPIGHPLVEILCKLSLKDKVAFNEESPINFKKEVSEEYKIKFKQAMRALHAIVNNEASLRYLSDENQKFIEDLAHAEKITNELVEKTLEIVSYSDVDVDFEAFKEVMLKVDFEAVGLKSYDEGLLTDLNGGYWDLEMPGLSKESVTFRFDNLPKDHNNKEMNFYARSSLKDLNKTGVVAIDFGTKSTTAAYMDNNGIYRLLSIGGDVDADCLEKYENPTIVEFRNKEKFLKAYNALSHRPFTEHDDMEVVHEAQKSLSSTQGNHLYRFFSKLKQWAGADEKQNFRDYEEDFSLESFAKCTDF
ncbi:hypothetical protein HpBT351_03970 [Helicobacter pylori]